MSTTYRILTKETVGNRDLKKYHVRFNMLLGDDYIYKWEKLGRHAAPIQASGVPSEIPEIIALTSYELYNVRYHISSQAIFDLGDFNLYVGYVDEREVVDEIKRYEYGLRMNETGIHILLYVKKTNSWYYSCTFPYRSVEAFLDSNIHRSW